MQKKKRPSEIQTFQTPVPEHDLTLIPGTNPYGHERNKSP